MWKVTTFLRAAFLCTVLTVATTAQTPTTDLDSCHEDLDRLRRMSSDAAEAASDAQSKKEDFANCKEYPETYDLVGDHCRSTEDEYKTSLNDLEDKMDDLDHKLRSIQDTCDYQFTINRLTSTEAAQRRVEESKRRLCAVQFGHVSRSCFSNVQIPNRRAMVSTMSRS